MKISALHFSDDGDIPNHPLWPMIVYQGVIGADAADAARAFEALFARHGWGNGWRNGIYAFPHYHSNSHEVLGIAEGEALVRFGGASGQEIKVVRGDAVRLPAGTGHERLKASADLLVIGAYPLDHDELGLKQPKLINVIDSQTLARDSRERPASTFSHPALGPRCDLKRAGETDKIEIRQRIGKVAKPAQDPISGGSGPAMTMWGG